ncbi:MAG: hypothetical protein V4622_07070 [Bacteroidota bacterium]
MKLLILFVFINGFVFSQKKYDTLLVFFNEAFVAPNYTLFSDIGERAGNGKLGFDFGLKHIFREQKQVYFVYGVEFCFTNSYYDNIYAFKGHGTKEYRNVTVFNFNISNSFNWRFHFGKSKHFFIETGLLLDFLIYSKVKGEFRYTYGTGKDFISLNTNYGGPSPSIGLNFGLGYNLFFNNVEVGIKPDIKFNLIPFLLMNNSYSYFQNFAYSRIVLNFRKLN